MAYNHVTIGCATISENGIISGTQEIPNLETIDNYMARLHAVILDSPQENEKLIATVRDIVGRLNIDG